MDDGNFRRDPFTEISCEISSLERQISSLQESISYEVGVSETRHREVMDYLLELKIRSDQRAEKIRHLLYMILLLLCFIAFKIS